MAEKLHIDIDALESMHRFGDILSDAIESIQSDLAEFRVIRDAKDCIGRHWYGVRCQVTCRKSGMGFYLHIGLIYLPATRTGLMIELDEQNNRSSYGNVLENIEEHSEFEINREEPEYFKLFMPDAVFADMSGRPRGEQAGILKNFVQSGAEAIVNADQRTGFRLNYQNLRDAFHLANAFEEALREMTSDICQVTVNLADKDNFGQYAEGFRYDLTDKKGCSLYAYFGVIYSYKKKPSGIFVEIDKHSNPENFDRVLERIEETEMYAHGASRNLDPSGMDGLRPIMYELSTAEAGFIKLFMKKEMEEALNQAEPEEQIRMLKEFLKACSEAMVLALNK